jgi:UDP-N-acetylglucosamine diphosphorylase/glucosamine-1-phosphate N-acetyltransferase
MGERHVRRVCLFEREPERLLPLVWLRPVADLRFGARTLAERVTHVWPGCSIVLSGRPYLAADWEDRTGIPMTGSVPSGETLFLRAGLALTPALARELDRHPSPVRLACGGAFAGTRLAPDGADPLPLGSELAAVLEERSRGLPVMELGEEAGVFELADILRHLGTLVLGDIAFAAGTPVTTDLEAGVRVLGDHLVVAGEGARIDPGTVLDARNGPIAIGDRAVISFGTWLVGPASIGPDVTLLGGTIGPLVGIGPSSRVRGELAESFVQGLSNKAHDGFIGHSFIGEWVNLGAMTTNSNLKNTYSTIRLDTGNAGADTGLRKCGAFIGDHVKTAIGSLLGTGTLIGPGANLFGDGGLSPKGVAPFAWGVRGKARTLALDRFLETAQHVAERRGQRWRSAYVELLRTVYEMC